MRPTPENVRITQHKWVTSAYGYWFFLGWAGVHKLYLNQPFAFLLYLPLNLFGVFLSVTNTEWKEYSVWCFAAVWLLLFIDIFIIPARVRKVNDMISKAQSESYRLYGYGVKGTRKKKKKNQA